MVEDSVAELDHPQQFREADLEVSGVVVRTVVVLLFSFTSPNADYGMHTGQVADVNDMGIGFVFEDMEFTNSDRDYNDLIIQISGPDSDAPTIDAMIGVTEKAEAGMERLV